MKKFFETAKAKVATGVVVGGVLVTQSQAAILAADAAFDITEYLLIAGVAGAGYLLIKGPEKALGLLKRF